MAGNNEIKTPKSNKIIEDKLTLDTMSEIMNESYSVIIGALVEGGLQKETEIEELNISRGVKPKGIITEAKLNDMISDFKNKKVGG